MTSDSRRRHGLVPKARTPLIALVSAFALLAVVAGSALAILAGSPSNFEANDGNMTHLSGNHDWDNVSFDHVTDLAQSTSDDSFTPGQKQDTTCPTTQGHKNPNKDDFTDVASFSETHAKDLGPYSEHVYLYGATIRVAANGSASENVELKQGTGGLCPGEPADGLLARVAGDKLIAIDYTNGGVSVDFHVLTWVTSGACFVGSDSAPCWGANVLALSAAAAEGKVNQDTILAADNPINGLRLVAGKFAEFGIDLSAGPNPIITPGACESFPQTVWESRSSGSSFVSSTKDVTLENHTISNCARVIIHKHTDPRGMNQDFGYQSDLAGGELSCSQDTVADSGDSAPAWTLNDNGNTDSDNAANTQDCTNVPGGTYSVTEDDPSADNFTLTDINCDASSTDNGSTVGTNQAGDGVDIDLKAGDTIECTFTNTPVSGALSIQKESTKTGNPLVANDGAEFCYDTSTGCTTTTVTDNGTGDEDSTTGSVCVSGLTPGTYYVNETKAPDGYGGASQSNQSVTVVGGTDCTTTLPGAGATATFTNPPLSDIQVNFRDGGSGETSATISCDNTDGTQDLTAASGWDTSDTESGVAPQKITCTITIDP